MRISEMKRLGMVAALTVAMAGTAVAQGGTVDPQCSAATTGTRDACQKAVDIFTYMAPQLGAAIAGGNTIMGSGGVLGGLPHWTVGVRGTAVFGSAPEFKSTNNPSATASSPVASNYTTSTAPIPFPAIDAAVGVFGGVPLGLTKVGGVDLIANVAYVPTLENKFDNFSIVPDKNIQIGYGVRIGLLQESLLVPGVSVSIIRRGLPTTTLTSHFTSSGVTGAREDTIQIKDLDLKTTSMRITISKSLILFGIAAGAGIDKYKESADLNTVIYRDVGPLLAQRIAPSAPFHVASDVTRKNVFVDAYMNLLLLKIVGEVGMVSGGDIKTYNTFDKLPNSSRAYAAAGLRIGF
jgi:hypothetical protein